MSEFYCEAFGASCLLLSSTSPTQQHAPAPVKSSVFCHPVPRTRVPPQFHGGVLVANYTSCSRFSLHAAHGPIHSEESRAILSCYREPTWCMWERALPLLLSPDSKQPFTSEETPLRNNVSEIFHWQNGINKQMPHVTSESEVKHLRQNSLRKITSSLCPFTHESSCVPLRPLLANSEPWPTVNARWQWRSTDVTPMAKARAASVCSVVQ